jgi:hypothetical protein
MVNVESQFLGWLAGLIQVGIFDHILWHYSVFENVNLLSSTDIDINYIGESNS